eukprot:403376478
MQKVILISALVLAALTKKTDFPSFDMLHANCAMHVTYSNQECSAVLEKLQSTIKDFTPEPKSKGLYKIKEQDADYVWTTRTTPTKHYVDDIIFELTQNGADCQVDSKSRSQTLSIYDYETNYCNMWTVHDAASGFSNLTTDHCKYVPTDPAARCAIY